MGASLKWNIFNVIVFALNMSSCFAKESQAMCLMVQILPDSQQFSARSHLSDSVWWSSLRACCFWSTSSPVVGSAWAPWNQPVARLGWPNTSYKMCFGAVVWSYGSQSWVSHDQSKNWEKERERDTGCTKMERMITVFMFDMFFLFWDFFLDICFPASLLFCSLLLCLFASLQDFCFSASLLFPAKSLLLCFPCFFASLLFCFFAVLLLCSAFPAFLLLKPKQSLLRYII